MIDLRSDTVTQPTPAMREAMMQAIVGDDVFGEDETVNTLEAQVAAQFGHEAALFCPSGTMTNQIALMLHTRPADEIICDHMSHIYIYEGGGMAKNAQAQARPLVGNSGRITPEQIAAAINPDDIHKAPTSLISLENTANRGGGACYALAEMQKIAATAKQHNLKLHLDGARIFNAMVACGYKGTDFGFLFDTLSVCLSKGLGAPVGSVLVGNTATILRAKRIRKLMGGGMRQAGFLAAAGLFALNNNVTRLEQDHKHAKLLADTLMQCSWVKAVVTPETNIVLFETVLPAAEWVTALNNDGIKCIAIGSHTIRFVTHLQIDADAISYVNSCLVKYQ